MRQLYDYIFESETIGNVGIDFDTFYNYVDNWDSYKEGYTDKYSKIVQQKLKERFGKKDFKIKAIIDDWVNAFMVEMSRMNVVIDENIMRFIYDKLINTPLSRLDKLIGAGANAATFDLGDKVIKCFYKNRMYEREKEFYELCKSRKFEDVLPIVYHIGKGYVIMEKVKVRTKKCTDIIHSLNKDNGTDTLYHLIQDGKTDEFKWDKKSEFTIQWMSKIRKVLDVLGYEHTDYGDLHPENIGERDNGDVVYFDI